MNDVPKNKTGMFHEGACSPWRKVETGLELLAKSLFCLDNENIGPGWEPCMREPGKLEQTLILSGHRDTIRTGTMLIRCDIHQDNGIEDLARSRVFGDFFKARGYQIAFAVRKSSYVQARQFLGEETTLYRLPEQEDEELERIGHLQRVHGHRVIFINMIAANSAYLFHIRRLFDHVIFFDHGAKYLIYADIILNPSIAAANHPCNCNPEARLLLGPKFHICSPTPSPPPDQFSLQYILLNLGNKEDPAFPVLAALASLKKAPIVHVLCDRTSKIPVKLRAFKETYPDLDVHPVIKSDSEAFPYERYPFIITTANIHCLDFVRAGLFFVTLAAYQDQLEQAYGLHQLGVSPTLGWFPSKKTVEVARHLEQYLQDPKTRTGFVQSGKALIDGGGLSRMAHFIPAEASPKS